MAALNLTRVLMTDGINVQCAEILRDHGLQVDVEAKMAKEELIKRLNAGDYQALLVRSATKVTEEVISACPSLRLVGRAGTGVDNIDLVAATRHGILVMNTPGGNTLSAVEHTCIMISSLSRNLFLACASLKDGKWERSKFMGSELYGKTLAVLGLGRIGREVAARMRSFGMKVIGFDPMVSVEEAAAFHVEKRELDAIWPDADYITVHTPLIPQTRNLINAASLSQCKRGVRVVNVARGGIVDEAALLAALQSGQCGGAGLDVFSEEPPTQLQLVRHPAVICTPHLGASTSEAQLRVATELAQQIATASAGGPIVGLANAANLSGAMSSEALGWQHVSRALGMLAAALAGVASRRAPFDLTISLDGEEMSSIRPYVAASVLVGLMAGMTRNGINLVNAPVLAAEAGIRVTVQQQQEQSDRRVLSVTVSVDGQQHTVTGTVQGGSPTLLTVDGATFDSGVTLGGHMLFFQADHSGSALMALITALAGRGAQVQTVLTAAGQTSVIAVRTGTEVDAPDSLQAEHVKFLLQASFSA